MGLLDEKLLHYGNMLSIIATCRARLKYNAVVRYVTPVVV